jgi:hypothetical protein
VYVESVSKKLSGRKTCDTFTVLKDLKAKGWPKDYAGILCFNCNFATRTGIPCPHKTKKDYLMKLIPPSAQTVEDDDAPKQTPKRPINETEEGTEALERLETVGEEFATILSNACATVSNASTRIPTVMLTSMLYGFSRDIEAMLTAMELGEATDGHKGRSAEASASRGTSRGSAARQIASGKTGSGRPKSDSKSDAKVDSGTASKKPAGTGRGRGRPKGSKNKAKGGTAKGSAAKHTGKSSAGRKSQAAKPKAKKRR